MSETSWQLGHHSQQVRAGDYRTLQSGSEATWRTRVIIPRDTGVVAVQVTEDDHTYWYLPGGGVEAGETLPQCAVREAQEETHLTVDPTRLLYIREQQGTLEFYIVATYVAGELMKGYDPEPDAIPFDAVGMLSFDQLEEDDALVFYPQAIRHRLRRDLTMPPTTALYLGDVP